MATVYGGGAGPRLPQPQTGSALLGRTDSQLDRALVNSGRAIDPMTQAYHTTTPGSVRTTQNAPTPITGGQQMQAPTFRDIGNWYTPSANAPQVSTNPLNNVDARFIPNFTAPMAQQQGYQTLTGAAPMAQRQDIMGNGGADAAMALMDYYGDERQAAARENAIARGMGRSGVGMALEDRVAAETDLNKQAIYQEYVNKQADLNQEVELANQQMQYSWQGLVEQTRMFQAQLNQDVELANQQAQIQMTGMQSQFAGQLAQIATARESLNAQMQQTQQQMLRSASEFDRSFSWSAQLDQFSANLQTQAHNEGIRQFNTGATLAQQSQAWQQQVDTWNNQNANRAMDLQYPNMGAGATARAQLTPSDWATIIEQGMYFRPDDPELAESNRMYLESLDQLGLPAPVTVAPQPQTQQTYTGRQR